MALLPSVCAFTEQTTPHSETLVQRGPKGADFSSLVGTSLTSHSLSFWPKLPHGLVLVADNRQRKKWLPVLVWVLLKAEHDTRTWVKVGYLRGYPSN